MSDMQSLPVSLSVPAEARFARVVRMTASNLAVLMGMDVNDVEDVRMAAEEGFVYACATKPELCEVSFDLCESEMRMGFALGDEDAEDSPDIDLDLVEPLLMAVCDDFGFSEDAATLLIVKKAASDAR